MLPILRLTVTCHIHPPPPACASSWTPWSCCTAWQSAQPWAPSPPSAAGWQSPGPGWGPQSSRMLQQPDRFFPGLHSSGSEDDHQRRWLSGHLLLLQEVQEKSEHNHPKKMYVYPGVNGLMFSLVQSPKFKINGKSFGQKQKNKFTDHPPPPNCSTYSRIHVRLKVCIYS